MKLLRFVMFCSGDFFFHPARTLRTNIFPPLKTVTPIIYNEVAQLPPLEILLNGIDPLLRKSLLDNIFSRPSVMTTFRTG